MTILQRWKQTALHNKALVLTSVLVAFGTIFYAGAAVFQVWLMKESATQSSKQIDRLVGAANESIRTAVRNSSDSLGKALQQNKDALNSVFSQNKAALDASIEASHTDQRAWVGVKDIVLTKPLTVGQKVVIQVTALNTGKTPAIDLSAVEITVGPEETSSTRNLTIKDEYRGVVAPNNTGVFLANMTYSAESVRAIIGGTIKIYIRGRLEYRDIFHRPHRTAFCGYYPTGGDTLNFYNCNTGNSMD